MTNQSIQELVDLYFQEPSESLRNAIITRSLPLVRSIIGKINRPDLPLTQWEDLESAGISGLLQAIDSYDTEKNIQFNTFAYYRIRGSVIDYLRKIDNMPRLQRSTYGKAQEVIDRLSQQLGRVPEDLEVAAEMEITLEEYHQLLNNVQQRNVLSLDGALGDEGKATMYDTVADPDSENPDASYDRKAMLDKLKKLIGDLNERDRLILTLYYFEDMTLSEIGLLLDRSEARISQIVGKLILQMRHSMKKDAEFFRS
ncbi:MAG: FliA/WhiG family RNA polymerase sigma factor [Balneolales bacterium]|nr:FliA/WhiG family RNA polymerase sigma factor [Balneolales bacterium]